MEKNNIMVSICCNTYNHGPYIADALKSLVRQKTDFGFEIIVHDDASIDNTADIIREFAEKYPNIIHPILEKENQHSKGVRITRDISVPAMKGKYIAFCEGDDFWTDDLKLQKQVQVLECNEEISMCCHANRRIDASTKEDIDILRATEQKSGYIDYLDCLSESNFPHLTSMVIRREDYLKMPEIYQNLPIGDYPLRAYALAIGKVYYIDEVMSSYRVMSQSSWSKRYRYNMEYRYNMNKKMDYFLEQYNEITNYKYHEYITRLIQEKDFKTAIYTGHYLEAKESVCYQDAGLARKLLINIGLMFPKVAIQLGCLYSKLKLLR